MLSQQIYHLWLLNSPIYFVHFKRAIATACFLTLDEQCRKSLDNRGIVGMVLMNLSKAFDCISHELLIAKLEAYGFGIDTLRLTFNYLTSRKPRVIVNSTYSSWLEITSGVSKESVLGSLIFNIYKNDLTFFIEDSYLCNFADDNANFASDFKLEGVISRLENDIQ